MVDTYRNIQCKDDVYCENSRAKHLCKASGIRKLRTILKYIIRNRSWWGIRKESQSEGASPSVMYFNMVIV